MSGKRYWRAYAALHGGRKELEGLEVAGKTIVKPRANLTPYEDQEQLVFSVWMTKRNIRHHHSPNGGSRSTGERAKFARLGTSSGYPDIQVPYARKGYHGLYIELKRVQGGRLEEEQKEWGDFLIAEGNAWHVAYGAKEAIRIVCDYFDIKE